jgi:hypothetical protein
MYNYDVEIDFIILFNKGKGLIEMVQKIHRSAHECMIT